MPNKGYNYDFRMYLEGVLTPFKSANIICTPNGVEANINLLSNKEAFNLLPKTAVQIFYKDWVNIDNKKLGWHLMFDGFLSSYFKVDQATEGRGLGIVCRDFRMDIRRAPAALAWMGAKDLTTKTYYHTAGIYHTWVEKGVTKKATAKSPGAKGTPIRTHGDSGLNDASFMIALIAGSAYGKGVKVKTQKDGNTAYENFGYGSKDDDGITKGGFYLDAVIRGMWLEATGGTAIGSFINKRIRVDKRFMVPKNNAGFDFWRRQAGGLQVGAALMGSSMFSSLEAAIMRLAGLFSVRVYSCNSPSLIDLNQKDNDWVIDKDVKKFLVDRVDFGGQYILNETMLLPPLEFTSPPNCNLIFPPMCHRIQWQYDIDADMTRGYFKQVDSLSTKGSKGLASKSVQIPTALFNITKEEGNKTDTYGRYKPQLTLEERYKGVNVYLGNVEYILAADDVNSSFLETTFSKKKIDKLNTEIADLKGKYDKLTGGVDATATLKKGMSPAKLNAIKQKIKKLTDKKNAAKKKKSSFINKHTTNALGRHALIKFLNTKYAGRVAIADMAFNPYIMCGFPGAIVADDEAYGGESMDTIIGTVQQVKHLLTISQGGADASTSIVLNNARLVSESTDVDSRGNPLYMKATDPSLTNSSKVDPETLKIINPAYHVPQPKADLETDLKDISYDLNERNIRPDYIYAKDFLTLTGKDLLSGERNRIYLDDIYEPNKISPFYKTVFNHKSRHFMIGDTTVGFDNIQFAYDTMHEAFTRLRDDRKDLLSNYENCVKYIARDVCSADAFFQGILGLSVPSEEDITDKTLFTNTTSGFEDHKIHSEYFGITTDEWDADKDPIKNLKKSADSTKDPKKKQGKMTGPGQFSSIREHLPLTAFIQERKDAVKKYVEKVSKVIQGIRRANVDR